MEERFVSASSALGSGCQDNEVEVAAFEDEELERAVLSTPLLDSSALGVVTVGASQASRPDAGDAGRSSDFGSKGPAPLPCGEPPW